MDATTICETSAEESFNWNELFNEFKAFHKISSKNVQALADLSEDISKLKLVDTGVDTFTCIEEKIKPLSDDTNTKRLGKEREEITSLKESEKKILKNIENITNKMSSITQEIEKCTEERKKMRKDNKTNEILLQRACEYYETKFNVKLDVKEQPQDDLKAVISFSNLPPEKSITMHVSLRDDMKIDGLKLMDKSQEETTRYLEKCLQDETKVTPTFCVVRDILNDN